MAPRIEHTEKDSATSGETKATQISSEISTRVDEHMRSLELQLNGISKNLTDLTQALRLPTAPPQNPRLGGSVVEPMQGMDALSRRHHMCLIAEETWNA